MGSVEPELVAFEMEHRGCGSSVERLDRPQQKRELQGRLQHHLSIQKVIKRSDWPYSHQIFFARGAAFRVETKRHEHGVL